MKSQNKIVRRRKPCKHPLFKEAYEQEIEFVCPVRGKIKQKVTVNRFKSLDSDVGKKTVLSGDDILHKLEEKDDGLDIYDGQELEDTAHQNEPEEQTE